MTHRFERLFASHLLVLLAGCGAGEDPGVESTACIDVDDAAECPTVAEASEILVGSQLCTSPVEEVLSVIALVDRADATTLYSTSLSDTGDVENSEDSCCYRVTVDVQTNQSCVIGRPLLADGVSVTAPLRRGRSWTAGQARPDVRGLGPQARAQLAAHWAEIARLEHASVASFARFTLDLLACGAPPELVAEAQRAALDEIGHAQAALGLASAYAGERLEPGPLPLGASVAVTADLAELAVAAFREGCVGETLGAALAAAQLRRATDPVVREVLARIVREEANHAALAWRTVAWAIAAGGESVRARVAEAAAEPASPQAQFEALAGTAAHGLLPADEVAAVWASTRRAVVNPLLGDLSCAA